MPRSPARLISSMPRPPDCDRNATLPATGCAGANVAFIRTAGAVFTTPRQFGPMTRMPLLPRQRDELALGGLALGARSRRSRRR